MRNETPAEQWSEIVTTARVIAEQVAHPPGGFTDRTMSKGPLAEDDVDAIHSIIGDTLILVTLIRDLAAHDGTVRTKLEDAEPWPE